MDEWRAEVENRFSERTLQVDRMGLRIWAQLAAQAELTGRRLPILDCLLMATAQCHGMTIVTRNVGDFERYPRLLNPWQSKDRRVGPR